jgi:hypothetical protein
MREADLRQQAESAIRRIAASRSKSVPPELRAEAAELLAGVWALASLRGLTPGLLGDRDHLARGVLDEVIAQRRAKRGGHKR